MDTPKNQWLPKHFKIGRSALFFILFSPLLVGNCSNSIKEAEPINFSTTNLSVGTFRNGDTIAEIISAADWIKAGNDGTPAWCSYDNDSLNHAVYGKLYNWFAVNDPRGLAPVGWHIPSDSEWTVLTDYWGGEAVAGGKMKTTSGWDSGGNGTNESSFTALPGGSRHGNGNFVDEIGGYAFWWSSTESASGSAYIRYLDYTNGKIMRASDGRKAGFSVRCVKD